MKNNEKQPLNKQEQKAKGSNRRMIASLTLLFSTVAVVISGITLYFHVGPKILSKEVHIWFSIMFIAGAIFHTIYNIRPLRNYLNGCASKTKSAFSKELVIPTVCSVGFLALSFVLAAPMMGANGKSSSLPSVTNIPLSTVLQVDKIDIAKAKAALTENGIKYEYVDLDIYVSDEIDTDQFEIFDIITLTDISVKNNLNPRKLYSIIASVR